jgi:hypothetical protein
MGKPAPATFHPSAEPPAVAMVVPMLPFVGFGFFLTAAQTVDRGVGLHDGLAILAFMVPFLFFPLVLGDHEDRPPRELASRAGQGILCLLFAPLVAGGVVRALAGVSVLAAQALGWAIAIGFVGLELGLVLWALTRRPRLPPLLATRRAGGGAVADGPGAAPGELVLHEEPATVRLAAGAVTCSYCGDALEVVDTVACRSCGTLHHTTCWETGGGCTTYGCSSSEASPLNASS